MKKAALFAVLLVMNVFFVLAQGTAQITFEKTSHNFGSFPESSPKVTCTFKFKKYRQWSAGHPPGHRFLRMHGTAVSERTDQAGRKRRSDRHLQRKPESFRDISAKPLPCAPIPKTKSRVWSLKAT